MARLLSALLLASVSILGAIALAQPMLTEGTDPPIVMEPVEVDLFTCRFPGRTLSSCTVTATLRNTKFADATPENMVGTPAVSGSDCNFTLTPDGGCGSSGCRAGNTYQIKCHAIDSNGGKPTKNIRLDVQKIVLNR